MPRPLTHAALTIAAPIGTVGALLLVIGCLATEKDRGQALADGIRYVQVGCAQYLADERIPRHPEADSLCPVILGEKPELDDAMVSEDASRTDAGAPVQQAEVPGTTSGAAGTLNTTPGNAVRAVDGG